MRAYVWANEKGRWEEALSEVKVWQSRRVIPNQTLSSTRGLIADHHLRLPNALAGQRRRVGASALNSDDERFKAANAVEPLGHLSIPDWH